MMPIVEAVGLKKIYMLGRIPVEALRGVNLKVESGDYWSRFDGYHTRFNSDGASRCLRIRHRRQRNLCSLSRLARFKTQTRRSFKIRIAQFIVEALRVEKTVS